MKIKEITRLIEEAAPLCYQESYDNCGFQVGDPDAEATKALLTLDVTESVIEEALQHGCNLIVAHHPLIFKGLKKITGRNYVERVVLAAIRNGITIYAAHTNLDNMQMGVNKKIAEKLGIRQPKILAPVSNELLQFYYYTPKDKADTVRDALFAAGAGTIAEYSECSFNMDGQGTFRPSENAHPAIGAAGGSRSTVHEVRTEMLIPAFLKEHLLKVLKSVHPYEEVAYGFIPLANRNQAVGAGMVGDLEAPMRVPDFWHMLKEKLDVTCIRHTKPVKAFIRKVALCGGSGSFLLPDAIAAGADIFVTGDFKYHQFFDAEDKIVIADVGHWETEHFTPEIFAEIINKKFRNFATILSKVNTNPIIYSF